MIYLSYPVTHANGRDIGFRNKIREMLDEREVRFYDPERDGRDVGRKATIAECQEWDFDMMKRCDAHLALWSETSYRSNGLLAELEWSRRVFNIRRAILVPSTSLLPGSWAIATAEGAVFQDLDAALAYLLEGATLAQLLK